MKERFYFKNGTLRSALFQVIQVVNDFLEEINRSGEYGHFDQERDLLADFLNVGTN
ncbi:hypothetical protein [Algoriphagus antarcticus]|uniref:hypothetical protein n=1 Tax=Algoriphagus antarcticus TaxID=238540 RepID=UPI00146E622E|nr:hypothetical protein [Algoriphagus antarcticus]